ncbi:MAG: glutathione S-transferase [Gammaproteobacteria bacterium]|nr:MAG: glutathione S-transferase [Gammaproteobacteria bacterium]
MKLYGSTTSPYVRRIRLYLAMLADKNKTDSLYQFVNMDIFSEAGRAQLLADNPTLKVPYLVDAEQNIFDSRVIFRYLNKKHSQPELSWREENLLTVIDAVNDSLVSLFLIKRSGLDNTQDYLFFNLQNERAATIISQLNTEVLNGNFEVWDYPTICLFCLLDWASLRELFPFDEFPALTKLMQKYKEQENLSSAVKETDPRN